MLRNYSLNFSLKLCGYFIIVLYKDFKAINCCLVHQNNYLRRWFGISFSFLFFFFFNWAFVSYQVWKSLFGSDGSSWLHGLSLVGSTSFSLRWLLLLRGAGSGAHRLSRCGSPAFLLRDVWYLPRSGIELVSPCLALADKLSINCHVSVCSLVPCLVTTKIWSDGH